ncbi:putative effector protein/endoglucanase [Ceratobasidium theobromae]|uniref:Cellulase n=1 Tax=Ceratobasidium theobromae TaxID=1582974 RepID=A0A5N5QD39_9AGAM|nr:putative effector protein/endoglucanase [Ceratobasidium theobromae]
MKFTNTLIALATFSATLAQSGSGVTTRYWDCCKESCGWSGKASVTAPVQSCDINNNPLSDNNVQSGCNGGGAYACANHSPFAVSDSLAYGFAAVSIQGGSESTWCCQCYELTFTSGAVSGQKMVVQATNTGGDLGSNHFDLMIPGGGVGAFPQGCVAQYGAPSTGWGAQYGGVSRFVTPDQSIRRERFNVSHLYKACPIAPSFPQHFKQAASGVSHGSKEQTTLRSYFNKSVAQLRSLILASVPGSDEDN